MANMVPLIATLAVVGASGAYYYYNIHCPDTNMERNDDGDCVCGDGYYLDPEDDTKCVALPTTEASECKGVLVNGVYIYDPDGDDLTDKLTDDVTKVQLDCLLCKACGTDQADDGRCLECQDSASRTTWKDTTADWKDKYHWDNKNTSTPISKDYSWGADEDYSEPTESTSSSDAEDYTTPKVVPPLYTPLAYNPQGSPVITDSRTGVPTREGWGLHSANNL